MRSSTENSALNMVRASELQRRNEAVRKIIEQAAKPLLSDADLDFFAKKFGESEPDYSNGQVLADLRYIQKRRECFNGDTVLPHAVEYLVKGWLDSGQFFDTGLPPDEDPLATRAHDYDDCRNGVDIVKTINLPGKDPEHHRVLTMAFDVTISNSKVIIGEKLRQYNNGLPYGFTRVKYYAERRQNSKTIIVSPHKKLVPRFVIGESDTSIEVTLKDKSSQDIEGYLKEDTPDSVLTRFKLLSEIYSQAILFRDKVPDDNEEYNKQATRMLRRIIVMTEKRLEECVEKMTPKMISDRNRMWAPEYAAPEVEALPKCDINKLKGVDGTGKAAVIIRDSLRDKDSSIYDEVYDKILSEVERINAENPGKMPAIAGRYFKAK